MKRARILYYQAMYFASWFVFGAVGLALNVVCIPLLPFTRLRWAERMARSLIQGLFGLWTRWLHATGALTVRWKGFEQPLPAGTLYLANHPTLVDATIILSKLPDAFCIFKPALMRNPCIAPAALLAGYVSGGQHVETIRSAARRLARGESLLVFPEGTRTAPGTCLGRIRPGIVLIARRSRSPIRVLFVRASAGLVTRGRPWWRPPDALPAWIELEVGPLVEHTTAVRAARIAEIIDECLRGALVEPVR